MPKMQTMNGLKTRTGNQLRTPMAAKKGFPNLAVIGSGGSTSGLSTIGVGSRLHGTSITGGLLGGNTAGGTSTELLSNYKSHPGSVMAGGGGGGITTDFDSISQLSQKAYTNTIAATRTIGSGGGGGSNIAIGDLANLETSDTSVIDYNLINEEIKYRANLDNMYKKGTYYVSKIMFI